ncbi:MAG TPA: MFS transporter [Sphingomonas sp.]|nr:MFS transporter [Sphingomonas sp.]
MFKAVEDHIAEGGRAENPASRSRLIIAMMLFVTVAITFLDRANLSLTVPQIEHDLGIDTRRMGWVLAAFGWTYAFFQIPGGWLVDRVTPRTLYPILLILWSLATMALGVAGGIVGLIILRILVGLLEAPAYSVNNRVATTWFPDHERASVIGFYTAGQYFGLAFLIPVLLWIQNIIGWHAVFFVTGGVGLAWGVIWLVVYREPRQFPSTNQAEIALIQAGGALVDLSRKTPRQPFSRADFRLVFGSRKLWGVYLGQFAVSSTQWFFITWFPTYLIQFRHMSFVKSGFYASVPFLGAFIGVLASGLWSDFMVRRGVNIGLARKIPIVTGLLLSCTTVGANYVESPEWVLGFMTLAFFGNGMATIGWSLISTMTLPRLIGLTGGAFNFIGNIAGITTPLVIGYLAQGGNFAPGLIYIATVALLGALTYTFVIGRVEKVRDPQFATDRPDRESQQ